MEEQAQLLNLNKKVVLYILAAHGCAIITCADTWLVGEHVEPMGTNPAIPHHRML